MLVKRLGTPVANPWRLLPEGKQAALDVLSLKVPLSCFPYTPALGFPSPCGLRPQGPLRGLTSPKAKPTGFFKDEATEGAGSRGGLRADAPWCGPLSAWAKGRRLAPKRRPSGPPPKVHILGADRPQRRSTAGFLTPLQAEDPTRRGACCPDPSGAKG